VARREDGAIAVVAVDDKSRLAKLERQLERRDAVRGLVAAV
jgi:hypothetical protein